MNRPRRAAAKKPEGHYAPASSIGKRKTGSTASTRKPRKKNDQTEQDAMGLDIPSPAPDTVPVPIPVVMPQPLDPAALALDLKQSYEGQIPQPTLPKRQKRWQQPATNPVVNITDAPIGWNSDEPDLDPDDLKSQIARCHERISDNIMSQEFQFKLEDLLQQQKRRDTMMALEPAGLSWPVVQRLQTLGGTLKWLQSEDDKYELVANVTNIMAAYRSGQLRWNPGLVTYWSKGVQLCQPRPFKWDEFDLINAEHAGHTGFWVEGLEVPGPVNQMASWATTQFTAFTSEMKIHVKIKDLARGPAKPVELIFLDDTGASLMQLNKSDVKRLVNYNADPIGNTPPSPAMLGTVALTLANGAVDYNICVRLYVNMLDKSTNAFLSPAWHPIQVVVLDDDFTAPKLRLNGPWPRHRMFSASVPDGSWRTYFSDLPPSSMVLPVPTALQMTSLLPDNRLVPAPAGAVP